MKRFNRFLVAAFMAAAMPLPDMVQAMEIRQFDKMAQDDRAEYVSELISGCGESFDGRRQSGSGPESRKSVYNECSG
jgi:hypothetical protein